MYTTLTRLSWPCLRILPWTRLRKGKEIKGRTEERFGKTNTPRPQGKIIWIHAASNGEALSALPLVNYLINLPSAPTILMTTMTVTAASLITQRTNSDNVIHQFIPYDHPAWIKRFHAHWSPDMVVWIESELWPNHLKAIQSLKIPTVLLNARLSDKSLRRWHHASQWFRNLMNTFTIILAQTERDKNNIESLGVTNVSVKGNLKDLSLPLPFDEFALQDLKNCIGKRPTLLYASTHDPEEEAACEIHSKLKAKFPDLLTIIVPRHPKRGHDIALTCKNNGYDVALRSLKMSPQIATDIYIADTLGELGVFYSLCSITFIGNSLGCKPGGGHNLLEPAWFDCAIVSGDDLHNFSVLAQEMPEVNACKIIHDKNDLYTTLKVLLEDIALQNTLASNALKYVASKQESGLKEIIKAIQPSCKSAGLL